MLKYERVDQKNGPICFKFERCGDSSDACLGARTHGRHLISLITFEIMRQIKNIRHQLPPVMIFELVCILDVYVCVWNVHAF